MPDLVEQPGRRDEGNGDLREVIRVTADGILVVSASGIVLFANPAAARVFGRTLAQLQQLPFGLPMVGGESAVELEVARPDGQFVVVEMQVAPIEWRGSDATVVTLRDVTDRVMAHRLLQASEDRYALTAAAVNDGMWDWDHLTGQVHTSSRLREMLGYPAQGRVEAPDRWLSRVHPEDLAGLMRAFSDHESGRTPRVAHEARLRRRDGTWMWVLLRGLAVREGDATVRFAGSVTDITERMQAEDALRKLALHDPLTGLANRALIIDRLQGAIDRRRRTGGEGFALVFLDLDHFKPINDSLGHAAGDALLVEVGQRIVECVRATDTVGRLGGDEFVVLLEAPADSDTVLRTVQRIRDALSAPFHGTDDGMHVSASIGILLGEDAPADPEAALRNADIAMYEAKTHGRDSYRIFASAMHEQAASRLRVRTRLQKAVASGDLFVRYQPVVDLGDGRISGFEALLRWRVDDGHVLDAAEFIDTAEETGVIVSAGWNVLETACRQVREWRDEGFPIHVAVNLADRQVTDPELANLVSTALTSAGVDGSALQLEITERAAVTPVTDAVVHLKECRGLGVDVVIDDFGTGFSSLTALHELPLTALKVDKIFVSRLDQDDEVVKSILALARTLGLNVVAEGIETAEQRRQIHALGCGVGQGYLFAPALDADEATRLLRAQPPVGAAGGKSAR